MASLTITELRKRNNFEILLKKIQSGTAIELTKEKQEQLGVESVIVKPDPVLIAGLEKFVEDPGEDPDKVFETLFKNKCLHIETEQGQELTSGALQKTWEFGSLTSEMVYEKESREQKNIQKNLKNLTVFGLKPITLVIETLGKNRYEFHKVVGVKNANKISKGFFGKADFDFVDKDGNLIFNVSHKFGKRPRHFRQWSGLKNFHGHPEVIKFGEDLKVAIEKEMTEDLKNKVFPKTLSFGRSIQDEDLKKKAIFGDNEVNFVFQGRCEFLATDKPFTYLLKAGMILSPDDDLKVLPDGYQPIILARRSDMKRGAFGIKGCRGMIYSKKGRQVHRFI